MVSGSRSPSVYRTRRGTLRGAFLRSTGAGLVLLALSSAGLPARAGEQTEKQVCAHAYVRGQRLRNSHKLVEANKQFLVCARDICPAVLRKDCVQ